MSDTIRLTAGSRAGGCAAKMSPRMLDSVLRRLPASSHPAVIVGYETSDDAGVYRLSDDLALVQTVDFFTPIVDDPFTFGQIAAANALSDVYAMGGRPISALSMVAFPAAGSPDVLEANLPRRPLENGGGGVRGPGRPFDPRRRNKVWLRGDRRDSSRPGVAERGSARVRRPAVHQAPGHGGNRHRAETRERPGVCGGGGDRVDDRG